jgi:hypothetical protein
MPAIFHDTPKLCQYTDGQLQKPILQYTLYFAELCFQMAEMFHP